MRVFPVLPLNEILKNFDKENVIVFAERCAQEGVFRVCEKLSVYHKILVVVGPEGGFSDEEFEFFKKSGFKLVTLGDLIYRAPNAVTAGVSTLIAGLKFFNDGIKGDDVPSENKEGSGF